MRHEAAFISTNASYSYSLSEAYCYDNKKMRANNNIVLKIMVNVTKIWLQQAKSLPKAAAGQFS